MLSNDDEISSIKEKITMTQKISKKMLEKLIKEELEGALAEADVGAAAPNMKDVETFMGALMKLPGLEMKVALINNPQEFMGLLEQLINMLVKGKPFEQQAMAYVRKVLQDMAKEGGKAPAEV